MSKDHSSATENWVVFPLLVALFAAVWHAAGHPL
jgi:hypothetical protein